MTTLLVLVPAFLGGVFAWSGTAKALRLGDTARAISRFGITRSPHRTMATLAAAAELLLAAVLLLATRLPSLAIPALGFSAAACLGFVLLIARSLRSKHAFACMCFGSSESRLSRRTLLRAIALLTASVSGLAGHKLVAVQHLNTAEAGAAVAAGSAALAVLALLAALGPVWARLDPFEWSENDYLALEGIGDLPVTS